MAEDKNLNNNDLNAADELANAPQEQQPVEYTDDNIRHLSDMEHVRTRPGMYIGRLGDGNLPEDGIYVLLKEVVDNSIDEFKMGAGARLEIDIEDNLRVSVRDYGRGIPQGKLVEAVSVLNTGGKYDSKAFKKSVGLNGVGVKAVNALSSHFEVKSFRDGKVRHLKFEKGILQSDKTEDTEDENGTFIFFEPDNTLFKNYSFHDDFVETMLRNYTYLNTGLTIMHNGRRILSRHGLKDLLTDNMTNEGLYEIVHMKGEDIEIAFTHTNQYGEEYYSFVNGQHSTQSAEEVQLIAETGMNAAGEKATFDRSGTQMSRIKRWLGIGDSLPKYQQKITASNRQEMYSYMAQANGSRTACTRSLLRRSPWSSTGQLRCAPHPALRPSSTRRSLSRPCAWRPTALPSAGWTSGCAARASMPLATA